MMRTDYDRFAHRKHWLAAIVAALLVSACSETTTTPLVPSAIEAITVGPLSAVVGQPLAEEVAVRVLDRTGLRIEGVPVTFTVIAGGGSVSTASTISGAQGVAETFWTLGPQAGVNRLEVRAEGVETPLIIEATGTAGSAAHFVLVSGNAQTDTVTQTLSQAVVFRLTDANGNPVPGVPIDWSWAWSGSTGTVTSASPTTNASGEWSVTWTLSQYAGDYLAVAVPRGTGMALGFSAKAVPDKPKWIRLSQPGSVAEFGSTVVEITSLDDFQNPSGGLSINLSATSGSLVEPTMVTTDATGKSFVTWTMPEAPATVTVNAFAPSSAYNLSVSAAVIHTSPVRLVVIPDTAYVQHSTSSEYHEAGFGAAMRDQYDHPIPIRFNCGDFSWSITPPAQILGRVGMLIGTAAVWSDTIGSYTVTGTCPSRGFSDTAVVIVQ